MSQKAMRMALPYLPVLSLLSAAVLWIAHEAWLWGLPFAVGFALSLRFETPYRRRRYLALAVPLLLLSAAPIATDTSLKGFLGLGSFFVAVLIVPSVLLRREKDNPITFAFWPKRGWRDKGGWLEPLYTLSSIPLAWAAFALYFGVLNPDVPFNWHLPADPETSSLLRLFIGINLVGIWDELYFININYAIFRQLFAARTANLAAAVIYTTVLWTMAFKGAGVIFVFVLAFTQGAMYERSKVLLWVLIVHLIVDYFLFQAIVQAYYPHLEVWWH